MILPRKTASLMVASLGLAPMTAKPQTDLAMAQQLPCLGPSTLPSTAYGFLALSIESLRHAKAAAELEPDSTTFVSGLMTVPYRYRAAADEYRCASRLVSGTLSQLRDSLRRTALLISVAYNGLGENDSARADVIRSMLNVMNSPNRLAFGTLSDTMGKLKLDSEKVGEGLGLAFLLSVQYFNEDGPSGRMLTKAQRDSLLVRLRQDFGPAVGPKHGEPRGNDYGTALAAQLYQLLSDPHWRIR